MAATRWASIRPAIKDTLGTRPSRTSVAPQVRLLPEMITHEEVLTLDGARDSKLVPIGANEEDLQPDYLDCNTEPHSYAFADGESGKTNLLWRIPRSRRAWSATSSTRCRGACRVRTSRTSSRSPGRGGWSRSSSSWSTTTTW